MSVQVVRSRALGWRPDPLDSRDRDAAALTATRTAPLPDEASNEDLVEIIDQGQLGSCTVNAAAQAVRAAIVLELMAMGMALAAALAATPFLSRLFLYYLARAVNGEQKVDAGTFIRLVFQQINKYGYPPESAWPYSDDSNPTTGAFAKMPPAEAFREAYDQRDSAANETAGLVSYSRITATGDARIAAIKSAIADRCLVVFGTDVSEDFCSGIDISKPIEEPLGKKIAGGHALCFAGYKGNDLLVANSWGKSYGSNGYIWFAPSYVKSSTTTDLWRVKHAPILRKAA